MSTTSPPVLPNLVYLGAAPNFQEEIYEVLGPLALFEGFTPEEHSTLCDYMECYAADQGVTIFSEGEVGDFLMLVLTGSVNVIKHDKDSGEKVVSEVGPGGFLGEMSLVDGQPRFASCVATLPTDVAILHRRDLAGMVSGHPQVGIKVLLLLLQLVTRRLRDATIRMLPTIESNWI
jgi:CRP-like cAMP-binding protein